LCACIKSTSKIITVAVALKSYSETKDINSIKVGCVTFGGGGLWCFKNNYSSGRVKSYSEIKDINSIKIWCVTWGGGVS
jgi:hypothetical protein